MAIEAYEARGVAQEREKAKVENHGKKGGPLSSTTVLLVEDDPLVRKLATSILQRMGGKVLVAEDGQQALDTLASQPNGTVDLLLTDVVMPGITVQELYRRAKEAHPDLCVVFMSGYGEGEVGRLGLPESEVRLIAKPFGVAALTKGVCEALDAPKASGHGAGDGEAGA